MTIISSILWFMAILGVAIFFKYSFIPYIKTKMMFWFFSVRIRRMAKKYDGETAEQLNELAKQLMDVSKSEKLIEDSE